MSDIDKLHPGWVSTNLGSVAEVVRGITFPAGAKNVRRGAGLVRCLRTTNVQEALETNDVLYVSPKYVRREDQWLRAGDIVISLANSYELVGKVAFASEQSERTTFGAFIAVIRAFGVEPKFLMYQLRSSATRTAMRSGSSQTVNIANLSLGTLNPLGVTFPGIEEQQRIVETIDSYLTRLDEAVASLERVQAKLKAYRASVLKAAVEGRLVPTEASLARSEKRDYEPAGALLARILKERRRRWEEAELAKLKAGGKTPKDDKWKAKYEDPVSPDTSSLPELPEGWCWSSLGQIGLVSGGLTQNANREHYKIKLPFLRVANVYANALVLDKIKMIGVEANEIERARLSAGDLLVVEGNGSIDQIGRVALWNGSIEPVLHQNHLIKVRFAPRQLSQWALTWLLSPAGRTTIQGVASSTSGLHTLSISKVARLPVPLPPLAEQARAFDEVDARRSVADSILESLPIDLRRCSRLRQAVLKWAFDGKLVDQGPIGEPAERLLARIRADRAADAPTEKRHSRTAKGAA